MQMTTVYLPETTHQELKQLAKSKQRPMSHLIRDFIARGLSTRQATGRSLLSKLAQYKLKMGKGLDARGIDKLVYQI